MSCKYPKESKMYYGCFICNEKNKCKDTYMLENIIPPASEVNKMANNAVDGCVAQQLIEISELIKNAVENGEFSIKKEGSLKYKTIMKLKELDYSVVINSQYYKISWR